MRRDWRPTDSALPCPTIGAEDEYIELRLNAYTAPALQDYAFSGLEIRFFDEAGQETGFSNPILTNVCMGDIGPITSEWKRSGGYSGSVLAHVGPGTTTAAYSAPWSYGWDETVYQWDLADF